MEGPYRAFIAVSVPSNSIQKAEDGNSIFTLLNILDSGSLLHRMPWAKKETYLEI